MGPELTRLTGLPGLPELTGLPRLTGLTELTGLAGLIQAGPQAACVGGHTRRTIFFFAHLCGKIALKFLRSKSAPRPGSSLSAKARLAHKTVLSFSVLQAEPPAGNFGSGGLPAVAFLMLAGTK